MTPAGEEDGRPLYVPAPDERQLTVRALVAGLLLGGLVAAMNIYFGLRTGWTIGGSLIAAILGHAAFAAIRPTQAYGPLENNITQTAASAGGGVAAASGLLTAVPALGLLGVELGYGDLALWALGISFLGVFFAVPLRRQMIVEERLPFPTGTVTAETILALRSEGEGGRTKARALVGAGALAAAWTLLGYFVPESTMPPMAWFGLGALGAYSIAIHVSPMLLGTGMLVGPRVGVSLLVGALLAWGVLAPTAESLGWVTGRTMSYQDGARGFILWPGVALMVAEALTGLALAWPTFVRAMRAIPSAASRAGAEAATAEQVPIGLVGLGVLLAGSLTVAVSWLAFDIAPWLGVLAIVVAAVLSVIATRAVGETDLNPLGGVGKVTQLIYGALDPGQMTTNLLAAGVTVAGAQQAADMMVDLKTGHLLGASPRKQLVAQLAGVLGGLVFCVPLYLLFDAAYGIGSERLPAPAAHSWKAMAEVLSKGTDALPAHAGPAVLVALGLGVAFPVLRRRPRVAPFVPNGLAMGLAFLVPAYYAVPMFVGAMGLLLWRRRRPAAAALLAFPIASGLVAGEGLMGIVSALLTLLEVPTLTGG